MPAETWGLMPKSQTESTTIDEAIANAIIDHESDPEAHQGEGESLQNHKSDEVIDHPANSVINDKIPNNTINPLQFEYDKYYHNVQLANTGELYNNTDGGGTFSQQPGKADLYVSGTPTKEVNCGTTSPCENFYWHIRKPGFQTTLKLSNTATQTAYFGVGEEGSTFFGFKIVNNTLYACKRITSTEYLTEITNITITARHKYRAEWLNNSQINYYIDDILVHTDTTNIPDDSTSNGGIYWTIKTTASVQHHLYIYDALYYEEKGV